MGTGKLELLDRVKKGDAQDILNLMDNPDTPIDIFILCYYKLVEINYSYIPVSDTKKKQSKYFFSKIKNTPSHLYFSKKTNTFNFLNYKIINKCLEEILIDIDFRFFKFALSKNHNIPFYGVSIIMKMNDKELLENLFKSPKMPLYYKLLADIRDKKEIIKDIETVLNLNC